MTQPVFNDKYEVKITDFNGVVQYVISAPVTLEVACLIADVLNESNALPDNRAIAIVPVN